jgi:DNA-binding FrmR family transcriptional regulator
MADILPGG